MAEEQLSQQARFFKTAWFAKAAKKAHIRDPELCAAMQQVLLGQADDLGGGVYKKRLGKNLYRSIVIARGGRFWIYTYLFAKQDKANIDDNDLARFRVLAASYARMSDSVVENEIESRELMEICDGSKQIQE